MRQWFIALLSLATSIFVVATEVETTQWPKGSTTHIGSRVPPASAKCSTIGELITEDDRTLQIFSCPCFDEQCSQG
tara:strand:+ start:11165 stop:11392 length:228 start_codon:yes stop_codon:yes gene_type:complete